MRRPENLSHSPLRIGRKTPSNAIKVPVFDNRIECANEALITKQEIADFLKVSIKTIDRMVSLKTIPHYKIGVCVRFNKSEIQEWAKENSKE